MTDTAEEGLTLEELLERAIRLEEDLGAYLTSMIPQMTPDIAARISPIKDCCERNARELQRILTEAGEIRALTDAIAD